MQCSDDNAQLPLCPVCNKPQETLMLVEFDSPYLGEYVCLPCAHTIELAWLDSLKEKE